MYTSLHSSRTPSRNPSQATCLSPQMTLFSIYSGLECARIRLYLRLFTLNFASMEQIYLVQRARRRGCHPSHLQFTSSFISGRYTCRSFTMKLPFVLAAPSAICFAVPTAISPVGLIGGSSCFCARPTCPMELIAVRTSSANLDTWVETWCK